MQQTTVETRGFPVLLPQRAVAKMLGVTPRTLERWRQIGEGPVFIRVGDLCRYRIDDLESWLDARRRISTSATEPPNDGRIAGGEAR